MPQTPAARRLAALLLVAPDQARAELVAALDAAGSVEGAAQRLGVSVRSLWRWEGSSPVVAGVLAEHREQLRLAEEEAKKEAAPDPPVEEWASRFWDKVDKDGHDGCWLWTDATSWNGYGRFYTGSRVMSAHRLSYELAVGPIPDGLQIDHLCRVRACVNPAHLEPVTLAENIRRGAAARSGDAQGDQP